MANVYVRSGAGGANNGSSKTDAYTTLAAALSAKAAGDNFWVASDHAEATGAAITLTSPGTADTPCTVMCVDFAGSTPPVAADVRTTAVVSCGAGGFQIQFGNGNTYWYGITFKSGTGFNDWGILHNGTGYNYFKNCVFWKAGTQASGSAIEIYGSGGNNDWGFVLDNTSFRLGSTDDSVNLGNRMIWKNTATAIITTEAVPTALLNFRLIANVVMDGVDFSGCASTSLFNNSTGTGNYEIRNCKFHASTGLSILGSLAGRELNIINADSGATNYRTERHTYYADLTTETTIVRTGGATDGVTPVSWKIVTDANLKWVRPFNCLPIAIWNDSTSNITATICGYIDQASLPTTDDIWVEWSYMGSSASPLATVTHAGKPNYLSAPFACASDSSIWGGGDTTTRFSMSSSFTPAMKGPIYAVVKISKPSATFYIDPKIVLS